MTVKLGQTWRFRGLNLDILYLVVGWTDGAEQGWSPRPAVHIMSLEDGRVGWQPIDMMIGEGAGNWSLEADPCMPGGEP